MSDVLVNNTTPRETLRQQFLAYAGAAFDLLFHPDHQTDLVSFDQREQRATEVSRDLSTWLLQQHLDADPQAQPPREQPPACPKCGHPGRPHPDPDDPLPCRPLTTLAGAVAFRRARWRCTTCRVVFFPPR